MQGQFSCKLEQGGGEKKPCKSSLSLNLPIVLSPQETYRLQEKMASGNAAWRITGLRNEVRTGKIGLTAHLPNSFLLLRKLEIGRNY